MPRDTLKQLRLDRNAALLDAMVLAASADGQISADELGGLLTRVIERPEFEGIDAQALSAMIEASAKRLTQAPSLDAVLHSIKERLPNHRNRLLAFGLATTIALADRKASREELGLLKSIQASLAISDADVSKVFEVVEQGRSLAEALGEPLEELYAETMVLVSAADGKVKKEELASMLENMAGDPTFQEASLESAQAYLRDAVINLTTDGLPQRLTVLAHGLATHARRLKAFRLAVRVAYANGKPSPAELRVLELLQATFGLADDEVARITVES
ncbi:MAG: tellurite resistance TerB family protein [Myxococcota bacterium]